MSTATLTMNPAIDVSTRVDRVASNRKLRCEGPRRQAGGGGINVATAMRELGAETLAVFPAGGPPGEMLRQLLGERGVEHVAVPVKRWTRTNLSVLDRSSDDQYRFVMPGQELTDEETEACLEAVRGLDPAPTYLVASGSLPPGVAPDFVDRLAATARHLEARLAVDTSGEALAQAARAGVYLLKPNLRELRDLTEVDTRSESGQEEALRQLVEHGGCEVAVLSLGKAGVLVYTGGGIERFRTPSVPVSSRVGAGDSMVAGLLTGLSRGYGVRKAVQLGVAAGAAAVMTAGTELCRRNDVERLFAEMETETLSGRLGD